MQFAGAVYHVFNRGSGGGGVFGTVERAKVFEAGLLETCARMGWRLHACALLPDGYHLALETPQPNLAEGMHWLQGTFATRLSRGRRARGPFFEGRYRARPLEPGDALAAMADGIHLAPARAGLVEPGQLGLFRWSSLRWFLRGPRPPCLEAAWLARHGLGDDAAGWAAYQARLRDLLAGAAPARRKRELFARGWVVGSADWRRTLAGEHARLALDPRRAAEQRDAALRAEWGRRLDALLAGAARTREAARAERKGAPWKIALAAALRQTTSATNAWIADALHMGAPGSVSQYLSQLRAGRART